MGLLAACNASGPATADAGDAPPQASGDGAAEVGEENAATADDGIANDAGMAPGARDDAGVMNPEAAAAEPEPTSVEPESAPTATEPDVGAAGGALGIGGAPGAGGSGADQGMGGSAGASGVPDEPLRFRFQHIALDPNLTLFTDFVFLPDGTSLLASKTGWIHHIDIEEDTANLLGSVRLDGVFDELDCGLISIALDPEFNTNQLFYVGHCTSIEESGVFRYTFSTDYSAVSEFKKEIVLARLSGAPRPWHNVGALAFDDDGNLFVPFGDKTDGRQAQNLSNNLGSLLRIVPNRDPDGHGYTPAPGNPFEGDATKSPDIYAYGLRSPWRGSLDSQGRFWVGDVGSSEVEEINVVLEPGSNLAWPSSEGPCTDCSASLATDPVTFWGRSFDHQYFREDPETLPITARVAWVGPEYRAENVDRYAGRLTGRVLFGEFCTGFVRAATLGNSGELTSDIALGHLETPTAWREGADGYLYVTSLGRCQSDVDRPSDQESRLLRAVAER